jgi:sec-independent protein translocase protein TatB
VFDIGFWEMSMIGLIALIILGPERLPAVARTVGLWVGRARRMVTDVKADINREIRQSELKDLEKLKDSVAETGSDIKSTMSSFGEDFKKESADLDLGDVGAEPVASKSGKAKRKGKKTNAEKDGEKTNG